MSLKMKLTSTIIAFFLVLGLVIMGVMAAPSATVNLGGTITFQATNVFAKVSGSVSGAENSEDINLPDLTFMEGQDATALEKHNSDLTSWSQTNLKFTEEGDAIVFLIKLENLASDRPVYGNIFLAEDMSTQVKSTITRVSSETATTGEIYVPGGLITLEPTGTENTSILYFRLVIELKDKNVSLQSDSKWGYKIELNNVSGIETQEYSEGFEFVKSERGYNTYSITSGPYIENVIIPGYIVNNGLTYQVDRVGQSMYGYDNSGNSYKIKTISILEGVIILDDGAFAYCENLESISLPNTLISIRGMAFMGCTSLTNIIIPDGVVEIGFGAFADCVFSNINLPSNLQVIDGRAFNNCQNITSVVIPSSTTKISNSAFSWCNSLVNITVDTDNNVYDSRDNCNAIIESATNKLIVGCKNSIIPNSVLIIGYEAFSECQSLTSITISENVTRIEGYAFSSCVELETVTIPQSLNFIEEGAFSSCENLKSVNYNGTEEQWNLLLENIESDNDYLINAQINFN